MNKQTLFPIPPNEEETSKGKRVLYKPMQVGSEVIFPDGTRYIRKPNGSLINMSPNNKHKSKKERAKEKRLKKRMEKETNENNI